MLTDPGSRALSLTSPDQLAHALHPGVTNRSFPIGHEQCCGSMAGRVKDLVTPPSSRFTVSEDGTMTNTESNPVAGRPRWRALLVEDEAPIRELVRLHLELAGFDVTEIADGSRALELGRTTRFD